MTDDAASRSEGTSAASAPTLKERRGESEFDRGLSFFDAIYGFAATLLIAAVDPPSAADWASWESLMGSELPIQLFGVALSFIVIVVMWRANVQIMRRLEALDGPTVLANLVAAAMVIFLPFTTQGISDGDSSALALPTAVYALNVAFASLAQTAVFQVGRARGLEREPTSRRENVPLVLDELVSPAVFLFSIPVAFVFDGHWAKLCWLVLVVIGPMSYRISARAIRRVRETQNSRGHES